MRMKKQSVHSSHPEIMKRLKRADGHLQTIIKMLEEERGCLEIAQQIHAVERAVNAAKKALIHDHIDNCLETAMGPTSREQRAPVDEFKAITKYL